MDRVKHMEPTADLRAQWQYNNFMYLAQGMIAERMTGKTWEENIRSHFFVPLGMTRSNFDVSVMAADADASLGYTVAKDKTIESMPYYAIRGMGPAGSINSSVLEMANWLKLWLHGGQYAKQRILPTAYFSDAMSSQMVIAPALPKVEQPDIHLGNYGLGWMIGSYRGHYQVEHGGNIDGFTASTAFFPADHLGIVVLANQNASAVPGVVRNIVADRFLGLQPIAWHTRNLQQDTTAIAAEQQDLGRIAGTKPTHLLADYTGRYDNVAYGAFTIHLDGDTLKTSLGTNRFLFSHYHYDVFELRELGKQQPIDAASSGLKVNFRTGFDGQVEAAAITLDDLSRGPVVFKRQPSATAVSAEQLQAYVGNYHFSGMTIKITVKDGVLYMDVPGQPNYETIARGEHYFKLKALDGFAIRFEMDAASGKAKSLYSIQPNGTFKAEKQQQ